MSPHSSVMNNSSNEFYPKGTLLTLVDLLRWRASHQAQKRAYTFLVDGEREEVHLTYQELDLRAQAIAAQLQQMGAIGERVLLLYPSGLAFITAFFGCLYAGMVAVPAYPPRRKGPNERLQAIITDSQATIALTTKAIFSDMKRLLVHTPQLTSLRWLETDMKSEVPSAWQEPVRLSRDRLAFLQYTSGSTGTPKGVMVSHGNMLHNLALLYQFFGYTPNSQGMSWLPLYHDMGLIGGVLQPLYGGFPIILMSPIAFLQKPLRWLEAISRYKVTICGGPNFAYDLCVQKITSEQRASLDLSSWDVAANGSEPVRAETLERFSATFEACGFRRSAFYPCYGMAETTLIVSGGLKTAPPVVLEVKKAALAQNRVETTGNHEEKTTTIVSCGKSGLGQKIIIVDPESTMPCPERKVGEIWLSGESVAQGYWKQPQETAQTFHAYLANSGKGPFLRTGDLGFLSQGELFVTGRLKDLIIIRGRNHYPQDIERTIEKSHPALRPASGAAFSVEVKSEERLVIAQEVKRTFIRKLRQETLQQEVIGAIRQAIVEQHDVAVYAVLLLRTASISKTSSGKIQRRACKAGFLTGKLRLIASNILPLTAAEGVTPQSEADLQKQLENRIVYWVANHLKQDIKLIDTSTPLSSFGIDSIAVADLSLELEKMVGRPIPDEILYDYPTIQALAAFLAEFASVKPVKSEEPAFNAQIVGNRGRRAKSPLLKPKRSSRRIAIPQFTLSKKSAEKRNEESDDYFI